MIAASTIFNLSSGYGKCGVSVIRVSGSRTMEALRTLVSSDFKPKPRFAALKPIYHPVSGDMIDKGLVLWFPGPNSFTGEDCCEFQVHGSVAVIGALMNALKTVPGLRQSEPGEFTKRAFFNGKLDLTEVDGLADLIHAETEAQRKQALLQSTGALSKLYQQWRKRLIRCCAHIEAYIDFVESEDIEDDVLDKVSGELQILKQEISNHLGDQRKGEILRNGARTVIIGAPNVGKSSLLNLLSQRSVSIVTPIAGTTRDIVESCSNISGYPVMFADTAGLRLNTKDVVEKEGIARAKEYMTNCDILLLLIDGKDLMENHVITEGSFNNFKLQYISQLGLSMETVQKKQPIVVVNKSDLIPPDITKRFAHLEVTLISCLQGEISGILLKLEERLKKICSQPTAENPSLTHSRYRYQLTDCLGYIDAFIGSSAGDVSPDLAIEAQKLRRAVKCIEKITGHVTTEDILDVVFKDFCIGK